MNASQMPETKTCSFWEESLHAHISILNMGIYKCYTLNEPQSSVSPRSSLLEGIKVYGFFLLSSGHNDLSTP